MSRREKSLLSLLLFALLVVGLLLGYKRIYEPRYKKGKRNLVQAQQEIQTAKGILADAELVAPEQEWLTDHEPSPTTQQAAQSTLQSECEESATSAELEIKRQTPLSSIQKEGTFYHRARMDMLVSGTEKSFYKWITKMDNPREFRRVTYLRLNPLRDDDSKIEASTVIEQWYVPSVDTQ